MISLRKFWPTAALAVGAYGLTFQPPKTQPIYSLVLYGDSRGYLAPCGCTSPMSGGIVRAATVIGELRKQSQSGTTVVFEGALVSGKGRQDELKAECYSETAGVEHAKALAYGPEEAALGPGIEVEINGLSNGVLVQSEIESTSPDSPQSVVHSGPFVIGAAARRPGAFSRYLADPVRSEDEAIRYLLLQSQPDDLPVLFTDGDEEHARALAKGFPQLRIIVFRSTSDPLDKPIRTGDTSIVTAGYHGKDVVDVAFAGTRPAGYSVVSLGEDVADDPTAARVYHNYLRRVGEENLLAKLPRFGTASYAGSASCAGCHRSAFKVWTASAHSHAYLDLERRGHDLDPDCVSCHVVGLSSKKGFRTVGETPGFANVGCESCHGPAREHASAPRKFLLQPVGAKTCETCHTPDNSPGFVFSAFWPKVKH